MNKVAEKLRKLADTMQKSIDQKLDPGVSHQNLTPRRVAMAGSMRAEARSLQRMQARMRALACLWDTDTVPTVLRDVQSKVLFETLTTYSSPPRWEGHPMTRAVQSAGLSDEAKYRAARDALLAIDIEVVQEDPKAVKLRELESDLVGRKLPGFFPTPPDLVKEIIARANIGSGMLVLEPSAGKGDLAEAARAAGADVVVECCEYNGTLREILTVRGFKIVANDFLDWFKAEPRYDRIVMNPPFEKGADIRHLWYAYYMLKPRGRLVSVMSSGPFFRQDRAATEFRDWLGSVGGVSEPLPDGSFKSAFCPTGVSTRLVVIDAP